MTARRAAGRLPATLLLTVPEAAEELRISESRMYELISRGEIPTCDVGTGAQRSRTRVPRKALEAYVDERTTVRPLRSAS